MARELNAQQMHGGQFGSHLQFGSPMDPEARLYDEQGTPIQQQDFAGDYEHEANYPSNVLREYQHQNGSRVPRLDLNKGGSVSFEPQYQYDANAGGAPVLYDAGMDLYGQQQQQPQPYLGDFEELPDLQYIDPNADESPITIIQQDHFSLPLAQISQLKSKSKMIAQMEKLKLSKKLQNSKNKDLKMDEKISNIEKSIFSYDVSVWSDYLCGRQVQRDVIVLFKQADARYDCQNGSLRPQFQQMYYFDRNAENYINCLDQAIDPVFKHHGLNPEEPMYQSIGISENGRYVFQVNYTKSLNSLYNECFRSDRAAFSREEMEQKFKDIYMHTLARSSSQEAPPFSSKHSEVKEDTQFFNIKLFKTLFYGISSTFTPHLKRLLLDEYRAWLVKEQNLEQFATFSLFKHYLQFTNMFLIDRETGKTYDLAISESFREKIERSTQAGETLIDFSIKSVHVSDSGSAIAILCEKVIRQFQRNNISHCLISCFDVDHENGLSEADIDRIMKDQEEYGLSHLSSTDKDIFMKVKEAQSQANCKQPIIIFPSWANQIIKIQGHLENFDLRSDQAQIAFFKNFEDISSLKRVNQNINIYFTKSVDDELKPVLDHNESTIVQSIFLIQQNEKADENYLEISTMEIRNKGMVKSNVHYAKLRKDKEGITKGFEQSIGMKKVYTKIEYENDDELLKKEDQIVARLSRLDTLHKAQNLTFIALNSSYLVYTKLIFVKYDESQIALQLDLYSMIGSQEQPPTDPVTGKAQLIVDDAQWTPDNQFVLILLRGASNSNRQGKQDFENFTPGTLCILPRLGVSFIRCFNPTRFNFSRQIGGSKYNSSAIGSSQAAQDDIITKTQIFMQLLINENVAQHLKSQSKVLKKFEKWQLAISNVQQENQGKIYQVFLNNGGQQLFEFSLSYLSQETVYNQNLQNEEKLFNLSPNKNEENAAKSPKSKKVSEKEKIRNQMGFMRYCMTEIGISSNPEFLMKIPEILQYFLPISYHDMIQHIYKVENQADLEKLKENKKKQKKKAENSEEEKKQEASPNKFEENIKKGMTSMGGVGSCVEVPNEDQYSFSNPNHEKYEAVKIVASIQKLITFCRWADMGCGGQSSSSNISQGYYQLSLNFKQWLLTIVNDSFYYILHQGEPILAFQILKFAENYFSNKNDTTEYYLHHNISSKNIHQDGKMIQMEVNNHLMNVQKSFELITQSIYDPQGEVLQQSQIEQKMVTEQNLISDLMPIQFPKNVYSSGQKEIDQYLVKDALIIDSGASHSMNYQFLSMKNLFQNHYSLIILYCMIQFRNYQAVNFNILYLAISNFISQRQMDPTFLRHFKETLRTLIMNYLKLKKTSEYEIFLGGSQRLNHLVLPLQSVEYLDNYIRICLNAKAGKQKTVEQQEDSNDWHQGHSIDFTESNEYIQFASQYSLLLKNNFNTLLNWYLERVGHGDSQFEVPQDEFLQINQQQEQHIKNISGRKGFQTGEECFIPISISSILKFIKAFGGDKRPFEVFKVLGEIVSLNNQSIEKYCQQMDSQVIQQQSQLPSKSSERAALDPRGINDDDESGPQEDNLPDSDDDSDSDEDDEEEKEEEDEALTIGDYEGGVNPAKQEPKQLNTKSSKTKTQSQSSEYMSEKSKNNSSKDDDSKSSNSQTSQGSAKKHGSEDESKANVHRNRNEQESKYINSNFSYICEVMFTHYVKSVFYDQKVLVPNVIDFQRMNVRQVTLTPSYVASLKKAFDKISAWQHGDTYYFDQLTQNDMNVKQSFIENIVASMSKHNKKSEFDLKALESSKLSKKSLLLMLANTNQYKEIYEISQKEGKLSIFSCQLIANELKKMLIMKQYFHEVNVLDAKKYDELFMAFQADKSVYQFKKMSSQELSELNKLQLQIYFQAQVVEEYVALYADWANKIAKYHQKKFSLGVMKEIKPFDPSTEQDMIHLLWQKLNKYFCEFKHEQRKKNMQQAQCDDNIFWLYKTVLDYAKNTTKSDETDLRKKLVYLFNSLPMPFSIFLKQHVQRQAIEQIDKILEYIILIRNQVEKRPDVQGSKLLYNKFSMQNQLEQNEESQSQNMQEQFPLTYRLLVQNIEGNMKYLRLFFNDFAFDEELKDQFKNYPKDFLLQQRMNKKIKIKLLNNIERLLLSSIRLEDTNLSDMLAKVQKAFSQYEGADQTYLVNLFSNLTVRLDDPKLITKSLCQMQSISNTNWILSIVAFIKNGVAFEALRYQIWKFNEEKSESKAKVVLLVEYFSQLMDLIKMTSLPVPNAPEDKRCLRSLMRFVNGEELYDLMIQLIAKIVDENSETVFNHVQDEEAVEVTKESLDPSDYFELDYLPLFQRAKKISVTALAHRMASYIVKLNQRILTDKQKTDLSDLVLKVQIKLNNELQGAPAAGVQQDQNPIKQQSYSLIIHLLKTLYMNNQKRGFLREIDQSINCAELISQLKCEVEYKISLRDKHEPLPTMEAWLTKMDLKKSSVPSLKSTYKKAYDVTSFIIDQSKTLDEINAESESLQNMLSIEFVSKVGGSTFYKETLAREDLLKLMQTSFRYININNQANTVDIEPRAITQLEQYFEHIQGIQQPDLQKIVIGFEDIVVLSRCFDYMVEVDFFNNNPLRYNGRGGKLFGLLEMRQNDSANYCLKKVEQKASKVQKRVQALLGSENAQNYISTGMATQPCQRSRVHQRPSPAGFGTEITDAEHALATAEDEKAAAPVPEEHAAGQKRRLIAKMKNLAQSMPSAQNYADLTLATEMNLPRFKLEPKTLKKPLPEATLILAATKEAKPPKQDPYRLILFPLKAPNTPIVFQSAVLQQRQSEKKLKLLHMHKLLDENLARLQKIQKATQQPSPQPG